MRFALVFLIWVFIHHSAYAGLSCEQVLLVGDLRTELIGVDVSLSTLQGFDREYLRKDLRKILDTKDVTRFYLGIHREPKAGEIKGRVDNYILRAEAVKGGERSTFDGKWMIQFQGQNVGYMDLTAVGNEFMPKKIRGHFEKKEKNDLYLAVGYALHEEFRGQSIIPKALEVILGFAKEKLKAKYIFASTNNLNESSKAVLLKTGFLPVFSDQVRTKFSIDLTKSEFE